VTGETAEGTATDGTAPAEGDAAADAATQKKTLKQLKEALQNAIDAEDYERAAQLRDIINQHKKP